MKKTLFVVVVLLISQQCFCWGFYGHRKINYLAVFLLPPDMIGFYKTHIDFLTEHSVDPDKRRYAIPEEGPRHYIDIDHYGSFPFSELPHNYDSAVTKFTADTVNAYGIVPWWVQTMLWRLTAAFKEKNQAKILKLSAEIGHYIADAHVPLHASHNHNGQFTNQNGIHGFWESRVPELLAEKEFDFWIDKAEHIKNPGQFIWKRVLESAAAADTVLRYEKELTQSFPADQKFSFENRNGITIRTYSTAFTTAYNHKLNGMVERRMRQSIFAVAGFWYTAWVNAGQPDLKKLSNKEFTAEELKEFEELNNNWRNGKIVGREHD
ncbi:zinc dependent phospholipase C family protein [Lacibacter sediminis]|uniref:S1/P1 Nuclease n=1 Tax=Lacibacter sediminis TaxID=2760713 RepID=A0A7G5XET7_9BACT|nr:zinc dependent phospholipase C family protein [Lacibacter sediminis]QNA43990.1 S1/P1 Nuclease [Lacibacter sediminis]